MSPGPEPYLGRNLAAATAAPAPGTSWPQEYIPGRLTASSTASNFTQAQLSINTTIPPRSSSLGFSNTMGQPFSRSSPSTNSPSGPPPSPSTPRGLGAAMVTGMKLKRAFANRRKKSEDVTKKMDRSFSRDETSASAHDHFIHQQQRIQATPSSSSSPAKLQVFSVGSSKKSFKISSQQSQQLPQHPPPPTPPKPAAVVTQHLNTSIRPDPRSSIIPISPGISSAVDYIRREEAQWVHQKEQEAKANENKLQKEEIMQVKQEDKAIEQAVAEKSDSDDKGELKDSWRKSDSTISHHTIRPGGRPSRPVSMADSLQSNHTVVPVSKRQSALIDDADFGMPEEDDISASAHDLHNVATSPSGPGVANNDITTADFHFVPGPSHKTRDHRSMSLNINTHASPMKQMLPPTPSSASANNLSYSLSEHSVHPPSIRGSSTGPDVHPQPPSLPARFPVYASHSTSDNNARTAWTGPGPHSQPTAFPASAPNHTSRTTPSNPYTTFPPPEPPSSSSSSSQKKSSSRHDRSLPSLPLQQPRQPTISMSSGFGLAKRAVEKMGLGRALGMGSSSASSNAHGHGHTPSSTSGYSSSSSGHTTYTTPPPPSSYGKHGPTSGSPGSVYTNNELSRTSSGQSSHIHHHTGGFLHKKHRLKQHNANAPSVSSITSASTSASASDSDVMMHESSLFLGKQLRGPVKRSGGLVFGRDLRSVVRETGVGVGMNVGVSGGKAKGWSGRWRNWEGGESEDEKGKGEKLAMEGAGASRKTRKGSVRKGQLKALEDRKLPSLVVRCAQHLLIWGVQEEGLFRIPGRALHVSRLRMEFDSGADYDMTECSPSDLDPHAVASVFKAYLRELPEPILTNALLPYFDAAMTQEGLANASHDVNSAPHTSLGKARGPGLPTDPRNRTAMIPGIRKPPSLSTLAVPNLTGLRPPSKLLLDTFRNLLTRLPEENRDLIRTVAELIRATALESHETKMPMSNLLLVFCPSLNMNPPLLRVLCEADGIWEDPVSVTPKDDGASSVVTSASVGDIGEESSEGGLRDGLDEDGERESLQSDSVGRTSEDVPSSVGYLASTEDVAQGQHWGSVPAVHRDGYGSSTSQPARPEAHDRRPSLAASSVIDDESSSDVHSRSHSLTSSAESLETPDTSSLPPLVPHLPVEGEPKSSQQQESPNLDIVEAEQPPAELSPLTPRRPVISNPIPITGLIKFPATTTGSTSPSPAKVERRRSIPVLSLPNLSLGSSTPGSPESPALSLASRAKRLKKPSLHLLFSKKSSSSFSSSNNVGSPAKSIRPAISNPYLQAPQSASDSSVSTPLSAVTAPQASPYGVPPKLDTPIEGSSLRLGLGMNSGVPEASIEHPKQERLPTAAADRSLPTPPESSALSHQSLDFVPSPSVSSPTPIADRYRSNSPYPSLSLGSKSQLSLVAPEEYETPPSSTHLRSKPIVRSRVYSTASSNASSSRLDLIDGEKPEEWTRSVLLAADADNDWAIQQPPAAARA